MVGSINSLAALAGSRAAPCTVLYSSSDADTDIAEQSANDVAIALSELGLYPAIRSLEAVQPGDLLASSFVFCCDSFPAPRWIPRRYLPDHYGVKSFLTANAIAFSGSPMEASGLAKNKEACAESLSLAQIATPQILDLHDIADTDFPIVIKPIFGGASDRVEIVMTADNLRHSTSFSRHRELIAQRYLPGDEYTVGVVERNNRAFSLRPLKLEFDGMILSHKIKTVGPYPKIVPTSSVAIAEIVEKAFEALGCKGYARIDVRMDRFGQPYIIDVNLSPRMSKSEYFAISGRRFGLEYRDLVAAILKNLP